jgi:hypothetical protein
LQYILPRLAPIYGRSMEQRRPKNISLPSVQTVFNEISSATGFDGYRRDPDPFLESPPRRASIPFSQFTRERPGSHGMERERPITPKQHRRPSAPYPSPGSEDAEDRVPPNESAMTQIWKLDENTPRTPRRSSNSSDSPIFVQYIPKEPVPQRRASISNRPSALKSGPDSPLTPTILHYRPNGVPSAKARRTSINSPTISKKDPSEMKIRLQKWDRDKGTAPLNIEPRQPPVPRVCILCMIVKRKVLPLQKLN